MVSVGGPSGNSNSGGSPISRKGGFIISPRLDAFENEMLILDNFNQIQAGNQRKIAIIGTQQVDDKHKQMIELLSYALVLSGNHVVTSGGNNGTNYAVIQGALRACNQDLLTVFLPQTLSEQPAETQRLLSQVANVVEQPELCTLDFKEAVNLSNELILSTVDEVLVFCYHGSNSILKAVHNAKKRSNLPITKFYLD